MIETTLTLAALFTANLLFIWGLNACFDEGMIFSEIAEWLDEKRGQRELLAELSEVETKIRDANTPNSEINALGLEMCRLREQAETIKPRIPEWLQKPLYSCPVCQSSIWGTLGYFSGTLILFGWSWPILALWPVYVVCLAGISAIILQLSPEGE